MIDKDIAISAYENKNSHLGTNIAGSYETNGEEMNVENNMNSMIECKTDREKMLCEQVLRMCRGEVIQRLVNGFWIDSDPLYLFIDGEYRAKPKKELIVPWEFLSSEIAEIVVTEAGYIKGYVNESEYHQLNGLSLDLESIELPVTVKRP